MRVFDNKQPLQGHAIASQLEIKGLGWAHI